MSKTTAEIAADCGMNGADTSMLNSVLTETMKPEHRHEERLHEIIGALYRRIERLESGVLELDADRIPVDDLINDYKLKGGEPVVWITINNISVEIARKDEGVAVALHPFGLEADQVEIAECWGLYSEAQNEIDDMKELS